MNNPLIAAIFEHLQTMPCGVSEHALLQHLRSVDESLLIDYKQSDLAMFQAHFMLMNALYQLQDQLFEAGRYLSISPLCIRLEALSTVQQANCPSDSGERIMRRYYLDWDNLAETTGEDIEELLAGFWQRYYAFDHQFEARACLGVPDSASWNDIVAAYRRLVVSHHPDKGGDAAQFIQIRQAYEQLQKTIFPHRLMDRC